MIKLKDLLKEAVKTDAKVGDAFRFKSRGLEYVSIIVDRNDFTEFDRGYEYQEIMFVVGGHEKVPYFGGSNHGSWKNILTGMKDGEKSELSSKEKKDIEDVRIKQAETLRSRGVTIHFEVINKVVGKDIIKGFENPLDDKYNDSAYKDGGKAYTSGQVTGDDYTSVNHKKEPKKKKGKFKAVSKPTGYDSTFDTAAAMKKAIQKGTHTKVPV